MVWKQTNKKKVKMPWKQTRFLILSGNRLWFCP